MSISEVTILKSDLELFRSLFETLHNKAVAEDLLLSYKNMGRRSTTSALTIEIEKVLSKFDAYLEEPEDDPDE